MLPSWEEGFDLVSAMRAATLSLDINGNVLVTFPINPYSAEQLVHQNPTVKVRSSWTLAGASGQGFSFNHSILAVKL